MQAAWKVLLQALVQSADLPEQERLCRELLSHFASPLNRPVLDQALSQAGDWDWGLLWAGVAAEALRQGDFQTALRAEQAAQASKYPQAVQAWLHLARWQSSRQNRPPDWLNSPAAQQMPVQWLYQWVQALLDAGLPSAAQTLLEQATDTHLLKQQLLGSIYESQGAYRKALSHYQAHSHWPEMALRQAEVFKNLGLTAEAASLLRKCLQASAPPAKAENQALLWARLHSQYLLCLTATHPEKVAAEQALWAERHRPTAMALPKPKRSARPRRKQSRLRVGYLAPDFGSHSLFHIILPIFQGHNRSEFEIYAYAGQTRKDAATRQLQACEVYWRNLKTDSLAQIATTLANDHLDLLIDAGGHTSQHFLPVLAARPAPLQISGLCFNGGTGLPEVDYQLTDAICSRQTYGRLRPQEWPLLLSSWLFWFPPAQTVPLQAPSGPPLLGCAHHPGRISPEICRIWAELLRAVPESLLLFKHRCFASPDTQAVFAQRFAALGIGPERLLFEGASPYLDYLAFYNRLHLALDPFPYHGGLTSAEALWMGVPLLNLQGPLLGGLSLLSQVGHPEWSAPSAPALLEQARALLSSPWDLRLRHTLRRACEAAPFTQKGLLLSELESHFKSLARVHGLGV